MKSYETILIVKAALLRAAVVVLSLALVMSGMAHAVGSHGVDHTGPSLVVTAAHDTTSAPGECDGNSNHAFNEACSQVAGCAFGIPAQAGVAYEPLEHGETVPTIVEVHHGTTAAPPIRPPKLSVQV